MSSRSRRLGNAFRHIEFVGECWIWTGDLRQGYGYHGGQPAHRALYELLVGPIPEGLDLDHLCRTPACVFPDHMEPVTPGENRRRAKSARTHCRNGHEYTPENAYIRAGTTTRICRICQAAAVRRYKARKLEVAS